MPTTLCNGCKKPSSSCICPQTSTSSALQFGNYPYWPAHPPSVYQFQTPRRPGLGSTLQTPRPNHVHAASVVPFYPVYPPFVIEPRAAEKSTGVQLPTVPQHVPSYPTSFHPPPTPLGNPISGNQPESRLRQQNLSTIPESPATRTTAKRKRAEGARASSSKRAKQSHGQSQVDIEDGKQDEIPVPGVGPSSVSRARPPAAQPKPIADYSPISKPRKRPPDSKQLATDVWFFVRPLETREPPTEPLAKWDPSRLKPKSPFVGCRLCSLPLWSAWANVNGIADTIRIHLQSKHGKEWRKIVALEKLKGWEKILEPQENGLVREVFTIEGFLERLSRWIAIDDQSLNVVDTQELRELLLYLNADLKDSDIPHRTKLTRIIFESYHREWKKLVSEIQNSMGRVSFTSDLWSDPNLRAFMAITAHFASKDSHGNLVIRNRLIAFRHILGTHTGSNLAEHFIEILKELGVQHKIGMITLDNASNCGSMMEDLERLLHQMGIPFCAEGNRIRCFPHVVNIAVKAALKELSVSAPDIADEDDVPIITDFNDNNAEYQAALKSDIIAKCRSLVSACRASGQRRDDLQSTIKEGNLTNAFPNSKQLRTVELLRDMDVRWSSTYLMIDRVLELYPAIDVLLNKMKYRDIHHHLFLEAELEVLRDIAQFLKIPHAVQTTLCGEKTPTLSAVLPTYEDLLEMLRAFKIICPQLRRAISVCIAKIEDYVKKSRKTRIYALAMIINPVTKLKWIEEYWSREEYQAAKEWMLASMLEYQKATRSRNEHYQQSHPQHPNATHPGSSSASAQSQASGLAYIRSLKANLKRTASQILAAPSPNAVTEHDLSSNSSQHQSEVDLQQSGLESIEERDQKAVADELQRYIDEGVLDEVEYKDDFSLTRYWQAKQYQFPLIYRVALDILPVQASSVACERVFSSSKETITMRRNGLSPELMEILQFLKYTYRQDRLDLTEGLVSLERDLLVAQAQSELLRPGVSATNVRELLTKGSIDELAGLLNT